MLRGETWLICELLAGNDPLEGKPSWVHRFLDAWAEFLQAKTDGHVAAWLDIVGENLSEATHLLGNADFDLDTFDPFRTVDFTGRDGYALLTLQIGVWRWP